MNFSRRKAINYKLFHKKSNLLSIFSIYKTLSTISFSVRIIMNNELRSKKVINSKIYYKKIHQKLTFFYEKSSTMNFTIGKAINYKYFNKKRHTDEHLCKNSEQQ